MIYVLTYCKIMPGTPMGYISDLLENASIDLNKAERMFNSMPMDKEYFRKEIWAINEIDGRRKLMKEQRFNG